LGELERLRSGERDPPIFSARDGRIHCVPIELISAAKSYRTWPWLEEEEEGTGVASDVVKVKGEDPATPGPLP